MSRPGRRPRPVPFTAWGMAASSPWCALFIGPGGADRLDRWAPYALTTLALTTGVGALLDLVRLTTERTSPMHDSRCEDCSGRYCSQCSGHYCCEPCPCERSHNCACECSDYDRRMTYTD